MNKIFFIPIFFLLISFRGWSMRALRIPEPRFRCAAQEPVYGLFPHQIKALVSFAVERILENPDISDQELRRLKIPPFVIFKSRKMISDIEGEAKVILSIGSCPEVGLLCGRFPLETVLAAKKFAFKVEVLSDGVFYKRPEEIDFTTMPSFPLKVCAIDWARAIGYVITKLKKGQEHGLYRERWLINAARRKYNLQQKIDRAIWEIETTRGLRDISRRDGQQPRRRSFHCCELLPLDLAGCSKDEGAEAIDSEDEGVCAEYRRAIDS